MTRAFEGLWSQTFRYAAEHSPFYREKFRDIKGVPALESLPTVDKQVLSERNLDFLRAARANYRNRHHQRHYRQTSALDADRIGRSPTGP